MELDVAGSYEKKVSLVKMIIKILRKTIGFILNDWRYHKFYAHTIEIKTKHTRNMYNCNQLRYYPIVIFN